MSIIEAEMGLFQQLSATQQRPVTSDQYLRAVLAKYRVPTGPGSITVVAANEIAPIIRAWADRFLLRLTFSGSYAKGTGVTGSNDIDLFVSLRPVPQAGLKEIYENLVAYLASNNLKPKRQRVAVRVVHRGVQIDIVPARKRPGTTYDHSIYNSKRDTWIQTNVDRHVRLVANSKRIEEIRAIKIWRDLNSLDFPSFYLELVVIDALRGKSFGRLAVNVWTVLEYLTTRFAGRRLLDPSNTNNVVSDDLTVQEKRLIVAAAQRSRQQAYWENIIW